MNTSIRCDGVTRRNFVRVGGLTALGLGVGNFLQPQRAAAANPISSVSKADFKATC